MAVRTGQPRGLRKQRIRSAIEPLPKPVDHLDLPLVRRRVVAKGPRGVRSQHDKLDVRTRP